MARDPRSTAPLAGPSRRTLIERKVRRRALKWRLRARAVDRRARRDPDFIVVGAQKAGSTSLFAYLAAHPEVDQPLVKEINYFTLWPGRGHDWYRRHFPLQQAEGHITGEASPMAMVHPYALERIALELPDVKVVAILRDPVARLLSHYRHSVKLGHEDLPLDQALRLEDQRVAADLAALERDRFHPAYDLQKFSYVRRSLYFDQVEKIETLFPQRCLFLRLEDLADPGSVRPLCEFLGIGFDPTVPFEAHNVNDKVAEATTDMLDADLVSRIRQDADLTCERLGWSPWAS